MGKAQEFPLYSDVQGQQQGQKTMETEKKTK